MNDTVGNRGGADKTLTVLLLAVFCTFFAALLWNPQYDVFFGDPGAGWHLANGKRIAATGQLVVDDPFLTAARGEKREWIYGQWLGDLLFHQLFSLGGFKLLYVGALILCLLPMYLQTVSVRSAPVLAAVLIPILLLASAIQWLFRPVLWSFLFFSLFLLEVRRIERDERIGLRGCLTLMVIFILWANLHPAYILGLLVVLIVATHTALLRNWRRASSWMCLAALLCVASCINPYGLGLLSSTFELGRSKYFLSLNREWLAPTADPAFYPAYLTMVLAVLLALRKGVRFSLPDSKLCIALVFAVLSMFSRRYIPFFALAVAAPLLSELSSWLADRYHRQSRLFVPMRLSRVTGVVAFGLAVSLSTVALFDSRIVGEEQAFASYPLKVARELRKIRQNEPELRLLHGPELGGFLTYMLWPPAIADIDDRNLLVTEKEYRENETVFQLAEGWEEILSRINPSMVLTASTKPIAAELQRNGWELLIEDKAAGNTDGDSYLLLKKPKS